VSAYVDQHRDRFGVEPICATLGVSASAYYQRATGARSARVVEDERLLAVIRETHAENYFAYGYRRMWKALVRAGELASRCRVQRLMVANGDPGREAAREAVADDHARSGGAACDGSRQAGLHGGAPEPLVGGRFHVSAVLGGRRVLQLRD